MLLWHGSRTTNFAGILSQGLRIAPPEAPVNGYMFGKGVYFADVRFFPSLTRWSANVRTNIVDDVQGRCPLIYFLLLLIIAFLVRGLLLPSFKWRYRCSSTL